MHGYKWCVYHSQVWNILLWGVKFFYFPISRQSPSIQLVLALLQPLIQSIILLFDVVSPVRYRTELMAARRTHEWSWDRPARAMGAHRHGQKGALAPPLWKYCKVFCALLVTAKRSVDELYFMHYFHNLSSASKCFPPCPQRDPSPCPTGGLSSPKS